MPMCDGFLFVSFFFFFFFFFTLLVLKSLFFLLLTFHLFMDIYKNEI